MPLLADLVKVYDRYHNDDSYDRIMTPIAFTWKKIDVEITIDIDGNMIDIVKLDKDQQYTLIPATKESECNRTSTTSAPYPLFETLKYIAGDTLAEEKKSREKYHNDYINVLTDWVEHSEYTPIHSILKYIEKNIILHDVVESKVLNSKKGEAPSIQNLLKTFVRFRIINYDKQQIWKDESFIKSWEDYYLKSRDSIGKKDIDFVTGDISNDIVYEHPKCLNAFGNAKLISANVKTEYTFEGERFTKPDQLPGISYYNSQKIHNALSWLVYNQGISSSTDADKRYFVVFDVDDSEKKIPSLSQVLFGKKDSIDKVKDYQEQIYNLLYGIKDISPSRCTTMMSIDAATTGRLSIINYQKISTDLFYKRIRNWYSACCYPVVDKWRSVAYSPTLFDIVNCAFGVEREGAKSYYLKSNNSILKNKLSELLMIVLSDRKVPWDIVRKIVENASYPLHYHSSDKGRRWNWEKVLNTCVAVVSKNKGEVNMILDEKNHDRSYLFGRLLAVLEKLELDTYKDDDKGRVPNAITYWDRFRRRPWDTFEILNRKLRPYKTKLSKTKPGSLIYYEKIVSSIMESFEGMDNMNEQLSSGYFVGYLLQKNEFYKKNEKED